MWLLILMTFVNTILHQRGFQNVYRLEFGVIQIGVVEVMIAVAFLYAVLRGGNVRSQFPVLRTHPAMVWILIVCGFATVFGILGGLANGSTPKWLLTQFREYATLPLCAWIAYRLIGTLKNVKTFVLSQLIAGPVAATMLFYYFSKNTEKASLSGSLNPIRGFGIDLYGQYAPITAFVMIYVILTRFPLWRTTVSMLVGLYCFIGYAATLSRTGFLVLFFGTASSYLLLPSGQRLPKFLRSLVFIPILFFASWGALWVGDQIIGRNFAGKVMEHILSTLPIEREGSKDYRAWDTRISGIMVELGIWMKNPVIGMGFGYGESAFLAGRASSADAMRHNGWSSNLAETGIAGTTGLAILMGAMILIGFRMVHRRSHPTLMLAGALGFFCGFDFLMRFTCTLAMFARNSIAVGFVCGMLIRAREIEETQLAMAREQQAYEPYDYVDEETGLLAPEYAHSPSYF